jgi:hypothetical protein
VGELAADALAGALETHGDGAAVDAEAAGDLDVVKALQAEEDDPALGRQQAVQDLAAGLALDEHIEGIGKLRLVDGALRPWPVPPKGRRSVQKSLSFGKSRTYVLYLLYHRKGDFLTRLCEAWKKWGNFNLVTFRQAAASFLEGGSVIWWPRRRSTRC